MFEFDKRRAKQLKIPDKGEYIHNIHSTQL